MVELFGKNYYIDIETITEKCQTGGTIKNDDDSVSLEINLFKYEVIKICLERVLGEFNETDEELGPIAGNSLSVSFKIAFNTLIKYGILIEEDDE
jgi:hypothetical protein